MTYSFFKRSYQEIINDELDEHYDDLIDSSLDIKEIDLDSDLELLLYDVREAITNNQILMIETASKYDISKRSTAYLIPVMYAYQKSSHFHNFIVVAANDNDVDLIAQKVEQLSNILHIDIPIHILKSKDNYLCLRRVLKEIKAHPTHYDFMESVFANNQRNERKDWSEVPDDVWEKFHIHKCMGKKCRFFSSCHYNLQKQAIGYSGCSIISQAQIAGGAITEQKEQNHTGLVIIDEAKYLNDNVSKGYMKTFDSDSVKDLLRRLCSYLQNHKDYSFTIENRAAGQEFIAILKEEASDDEIMCTDDLKKRAKSLSSSLKKALIHLTHLSAYVTDNPSIDQMSNNIKDLTDFLDDIAAGGIGYVYHTEKDPNYVNYRILYRPIRVRAIIDDFLNNFNCSIVFTGSDIANNDNEYSVLDETLDINDLNREVIKEFSIK